MANYFSENGDLQAQFANLDLREIVELLESGYANPATDGAQMPGPENYVEAMAFYGASLELLGEIAADYIAPRRASIDAAGCRLCDGRVIYAKETDEARKKLAEGGFMGVMLPREYGGMHFPASIYMMMIELVSRADASLMTLFGYQDVGELIARYGAREQAKEFLPGLASGDLIGAMVLSEPNAGSDLRSIKLRAMQTDDGAWRLNGVKHFISNGGGDVLMVLARSEEGSADIFGLSLFICPRSDGVKVARIEEKMGLHGSPTCELLFENAPAYLVGKRKFGLARYILESLNQARFSVAAQALGIAEGACEQARGYAGQREQFGRKIESFPAVSELLEGMRCTLDTCRAMLYEGVKWLDLKVQLEEVLAQKRAAPQARGEIQSRLREATKYVNLLSPLVKYVVTEAANAVCYDAQQVFGGAGYMRETGIEQLVRDVRITSIYEGTSQIQIAASLKFILADVLQELFDEWLGAEYPPHLIDVVDQIAQARQRFEQYRQALADINSETVNEAAARDLADIYGRLFGSFVVLRKAAVHADRVDSARRFAIQSNASAGAKLAALRNGKYDRWLAESEPAEQTPDVD